MAAQALLFDQDLINQTSSTSSSITGAAYLIVPEGPDNDPEDVERWFRVFWNITITGGTSPTVDSKLQTSINGTDWVDLSAMTQQTSGTRSESKEPAYIHKYVRAIITLGGTANPTVTAAKVKLCCNRSFKLVAA